MTPTINQHVMPRHHSQRGSISSATTALTLCIIIIISVTALTFFYLGQVQDTAAQGTDVQALENKLQQLRERQRELELEGARLRSIQAIEERARQLNLISADQFAYLPQKPGRVVTLTP